MFAVGASRAQQPVPPSLVQPCSLINSTYEGQIVTSCLPGATLLTVTDGTTTMTKVGSILFSGATLSGTSPNATLTFSAGGSTSPFLALGNGASASASSVIRWGHWLNAIDDGGVKADGLLEAVNVTCVSGSHNIAIATSEGYPAPAAFTSADLNKSVDIPGCGGHFIGAGVPVVANAGSGYVFGEIITAAGGTLGGGHALRFIVLGTNGNYLTQAGGITVVAYYDGGDYSVFPSGTVTQGSTTKSGTGATFTLPTPFSVLTGAISAIVTPSLITVSNAATATETLQTERITYGTDQTTAINTAITSLSASRPNPGGTLYFPTSPSGNCYMFTGQIQLPMNANWPLNNQIMMVGDGPSSTLCGGAPGAEVVVGPVGYSRGARITNLTIDGGYVGTHQIELLNGSQTTLDHLWVVNGAPGGSNIKITAGENFLSDSFINNDYTFLPSLADFPAFCLDVEGADNHVSNTVFFNSQTAQVFDAAADNHYSLNHGYGFPVSGYVAPYNFIVAGASIWQGNTGDTATVANFLVESYGAQLIGNRALSAGTTPVGYSIFSNVQNAVVVGNWSDLTSVTVAVQVQPSTPGGGPIVGVDTLIAWNVGNIPNGVFSWLGPIVSGVTGSETQQYGATILGYLGNYGSVFGTGSFWLGDTAYDNFTTCRFGLAGGNNGWIGDSQIQFTLMRGSGTAGSHDLVSCGPGGHSATNQIRLRIDIPASEDVTISLNSFCSTGDFQYATNHFGLQQTTKTALGVVFQNASGTTTSPPTWTVSRTSAGATSGAWTPAVVLDNTNGGAWITMTGTCTGSKTIYSNAYVTIQETGAGTN